jgi:hypothetical protein
MAENEGNAGLSLIQGGEGITAEEMKKQESGLVWIKKRAEFLTSEWIKEFFPAPSGVVQADLHEIAQRYADLENDFKFIKETAEFTAQRYAEFESVLPTLREIDWLINGVTGWPEEDGEFFLTGSKKDRLDKLTKIRSAIYALQQHG